jgi:hypothetical protein
MSLAIDDILLHGRAFDPKCRMPTANLRGTIRALFEELAGKPIDYVLVGGVALLSYVEGRNTQDIDLIVRPEDLGKMPWSAVKQDDDLGRAEYRGLRVALLLTQNAVFEHVRAHETATIAFDELRVPCATREGLVLLKLYALPSLYRRGNLARAALYETDVLMLHQGATVDDARLLDELSRHLPKSDVDELARILDEQRTRSRFSR